MRAVTRPAAVTNYASTAEPSPTPTFFGASLKPILVDAIAKDTHFRTDESAVYYGVGEGFGSHQTVNHSIKEYVRGNAHTTRLRGTFRFSSAASMASIITSAPGT